MSFAHVGSSSLLLPAALARLGWHADLSIQDFRVIGERPPNALGYLYRVVVPLPDGFEEAPGDGWYIGATLQDQGHHRRKQHRQQGARGKNLLYRAIRASGGFGRCTFEIVGLADNRADLEQLEIDGIAALRERVDIHPLNTLRGGNLRDAIPAEPKVIARIPLCDLAKRYLWHLAENPSSNNWSYQFVIRPAEEHAFHLVRRDLNNAGYIAIDSWDSTWTITDHGCLAL